MSVEILEWLLKELDKMLLEVRAEEAAYQSMLEVRAEEAAYQSMLEAIQ